MVNRDLSDYRREYALSGLTRKDLLTDPIEQFKRWFEHAEQAELLDETAMVLTTVSAENKPSARVVLLKQFDEKGFVFFTNYESEKGQDMAQNPNVTLLFPWTSLERQVEISGTVEKIPTQASADYFHSRPRDSQLGAWVSHQSQVIENRQVLEQRLEHYTEVFADQEIPLPEYWGGYRVVPERIEFWQGRINRLHDRFEYLKKQNGWKINRLSP
jgi:pyridoxamine 5'-phosphate oxidase